MKNKQKITLIILISFALILAIFVKFRDNQRSYIDNEMCEHKEYSVEEVFTQEEKIELIIENLDQIDTDNLYKMYREMPFGTDLKTAVFSELNSRGYWDQERKEEEQEAINIYNKYK